VTDVIDAGHLQIHCFTDLVPSLDDLIERAGRHGYWMIEGLTVVVAVPISG
tara:strand:- start:553 stop:705 length:153 start_codon:yes stop_codon:yes gene_type:complete